MMTAALAAELKHNAAVLAAHIAPNSTCGDEVVTEADIYAGLNDLFHELFADDNIVLKPETTAKDIDGWDSFNNLNIMVAVETRFRIKMTSTEVESLRNIGDLVNIIASRAG